MVHPVGDAASVLELARGFRREARRVRELQVTAQGRAAKTHWVGKRASRVKSGVKAQRLPVGAAAGELMRMAKVLEDHADWIRRTIAKHENLERRIRVWAAANPPDPSKPGPDASWIKVWPRRHSFRWVDMARQLQAAGARF